MFKLENVTKSFISENSQVTAVSDVSLHIRAGEIFGVIGSSGAGKSTLIRCINLLEIPQSGKVLFKGEDLLKLSMPQLRLKRQKIGIIFQNFNLLSSRTVFDNVAFPIKNKSKAEVSKKVYKLLEIVGISDKAKSYPSQLSGGQKQRVAIARALANDPDVLLCDEATSALDPQTTKSILSLLKDLNRKLDLTIILITHEMEVIKSICDRVAIMDKGKIVEVDSVINIFTQAKSEVSKSFVQEDISINDLKGLIVENDLIEKNSHVYELFYTQTTASKSLISDLIKKYDISINIIAGSIEIISNESVGRLVIIIKGEPPVVDKALAYLVNSGVLIKEVVINV